MTTRARVSIVGGSGYAGGELLRLLLAHPEVEIAQVTSESQAGNYVHSLHPNLRPVASRPQTAGARSLCASPAQPSWRRATCCSWPCRTARRRAASPQFADLAERIVDLSADFRLRDAQVYQHYYGEAHKAPDWLERFVYGLPEINRELHPRGALRERRRLQRHRFDPGPAALEPGGVASAGAAAGSGRQGRLLRGRRLAQPGLASPGTQRRRALVCPDRAPARGRSGAGAGASGHLPVGHLNRIGARRAGHGPYLGGAGRGRQGAVARLPERLRRRAFRAHRARAGGHLPPSGAETAGRHQPGRRRLGPGPAHRPAGRPRRPSTTWARARRAAPCSA